MARKSNKQKFIEELLQQVETDPQYLELRSALYKEFILHLMMGKPRRLYDNFVENASFSYDYHKEVLNDPDPRSSLIGHMTVISSDLMENAIKEVNKLKVL
jgi:hypothetical protein